jgi:hypothetical protein
LPEGGQARVQARDEPVLYTAHLALGSASRSRKVDGIRATGDVDVARRRRDGHGERPVLAVTAEERGLAERRQAGVQARDERVDHAAAGYALGSAGDTREIPGVRRTRDVDVTGRRCDRDRVHRVAVAASAEVGRLLERRQAGVEARHEAIQGIREVGASQCALGSPARAREVGRAGESDDVDVARRRCDGEPYGDIVTAAAQERRLLEPRQIVGQPRDERIRGAAEAGLCARARAGEVEGGRAARHVDVARWSDREGERLVVAAAAERGRLEQRVDHHR